MKRTKFAAALTATAALCVAGFGATMASAEPTPQTTDIVGVGSDTTQIAVNAIVDGYLEGASWTPGYNSANSVRIMSFDAINPYTKAKNDSITLKVNTAPIARPDGSGSGKSRLYGTGNLAAVNFARSSSALNGTEQTAQLAAFPFAVDEVAAGVKAGTSYAPAALSCLQLVKIYNGTYTNWSQVGGQNVAITALLPQSGSGTRDFFLAQLKACNSNVDVTIASSVNQTVQEHDATVFTTYTNAVVPFSVGRASLVPGTVAFTKSGTPSEGTPAFDAKRAVWNVVRGADKDAQWVQDLFGPDGYFCSFTATPNIVAGGLFQLQSPSYADDGQCGVYHQDTNQPTNLNVW